MKINGHRNVTLCEFGLGESSAEQDFYAIDKDNAGLGTFSPLDQYDMPLRKIGVFRLTNGDLWVQSEGLNRVDAIKIDVQGFEHEVLSGLKGALARFRPIVWFECSTATEAKLGTMESVSAVIPYAFDLYRFVSVSRGLNRIVELQKVAGPSSLSGDYVVVPRGS
jgi:FkbM family methyltransferase